MTPTAPEPGDHEASALDAGDFTQWLSQMRAALRGDQPADVPCGTCTACCTSSQFVHVEPDEEDALGHIPRELLFPAPGLPTGYQLLGYDEHGHCPLLVDGGCSIYPHRPRACRTFDCRILTATGVSPDGEQQSRIARQAARWRFRYADDDAKKEQAHLVDVAAATSGSPYRRAVSAVEAADPLTRR